ncbi:MAG: ABC transporter ATP-binding protein [Clostridia bacterium]|nr:ABC transporter ATP-binding protein [Clostridia bacterium]
MRRIAGYLKPYIAAIALGLSCKFIGTIAELFLPWILSHMIDNVAPTKNVSSIIVWGVIMALCAAVALWGNVTANRRSSAVARDATRSIRHDLFKKIEHLSSKQMDDLTVPSLISRMSSDTYNINSAIARLQRIGVRAPILLMGGVTVTLIQDFRLSLVLIATMPLLAVGVVVITRSGIPLYRKVQTALDRMLRTVRDDIVGIRVIRALSKGEYERGHFHGDNRALSSQQIHADTIMSATNPLMNLLLNGGQTAMVVVGAYLVHGGLSSPGTIIAFLSYFTTILNSVMAINRIFVMLSKTTASADRIDEVLSLPDEAPSGGLARLKTKAHVVFDDVSFSYNGRHTDLDHVTFALEKGQTLGVIGATGSGKTTLIQLLQRFYRVSDGAIYIGGRNVNTFSDQELHTMFGVAFQSDSFFEGTIRENIDLGRGLPQDQIERAARVAQAAEFIAGKEGGYDHHVNAKAVNLSGGQRQRLLIARALAGNPDILILDDSSSALDYRTDAAMRGALRREYPDVTTVLIAQRVSSVRGSDQILVLENGAPAGLGTHDSLMADCPLYAQISRIQTGEDNPGMDADFNQKGVDANASA